ncbi:MAG: hypothetical protein M1822_000884 [Bathelium mastoideum]|nr:MAG: hypothetical protein M1822_000884 [Bathelium mastoideum]
MPQAVHRPQPRPSRKRSLKNIDSESPPTSKHPRLAPFPSPAPPANPSNRPSRTSKQRKSNDKPTSEDGDSDYTPSRRLAESVRQWLSDVPNYVVIKKATPVAGPSNCLGSTPIKVEKSSPRKVEKSPPIKVEKSPPIKVEKSPQIKVEKSSQNVQAPPPIPSASKTRPNTSDPLYRSLIHRNNITLDPSGRDVDDDIRKLLDKHILKPGDSPRLTGTEVFDVVDTAVDLLDHAEGKASALIDTKAFPVKRAGVSEGRNAQWSTDGLPSNPKYPHQLYAPKPDRHYGYPLGRKSNWTDEEMVIVDHRTAQPYTQPTGENLFPFLMLEIKSDATGGGLYVAENRAVGSGVHSVESLRWLLSQAFPSQAPAATDAVAFTGAISPRFAVFYVLWYSEKKQRYIMSKFKSISFMEGPERPDIQQCRDIVKNMLTYGADIRQPIIRKALAQFKGVAPPHWEKSR